METIRRRTELRAAGRRLSGIVLPYGEESPAHHERFEPGAIRFASAVPLNLHHQHLAAVAWRPGGGLELNDGADALRMTATIAPIPAGDVALAEVRAGRIRGLSVEFHPLQERRENGIRVVERAVLSGIGLVRAPSYEGARVEARARSGRTLRATIPADESLACECIGGECANMVRLEREVMRPLADMIAEAFADAEAGRLGRDVLAVAKDYGNPIASARRGTLRATTGGAGLEIEADLPAGRVGDDVVSASETAGVIARPLIDFDLPGDHVHGYAGGARGEPCAGEGFSDRRDRCPGRMAGRADRL